MADETIKDENLSDLSGNEDKLSKYEKPLPEKPKSSSDLEAVYDIPVAVSTVLGKATMEVHELLKLGRGSVVKLDRKVGESIDIYVNNRLVARGEALITSTGNLGVTMTEIIKSDK
ncbi:MAG: flagellar motor switch protein FliN [Alphaproteobacteria bacterium]|nr:flagellar motor switch protein FliN [Alphaproteobacteria bacterium]